MPDKFEAMIVVKRGIPDASVISLDGGDCLLGKSSTATVAIDNPYISRHHAKIVRGKDHFQVQDLGSKNGTFVNGVRLESGTARRLNSGDRVELAGDQVMLVFQEWGATATLLPLDQAGPEDLVVDGRSREVRMLGSRMDPPLSRKEFDVLDLLYQRRGEACSKDEIAAIGWPERVEGDVADQDIEQCIRRLRLRVEPKPSEPSYILTIRGYGYKLSRTEAR